MSAAAGHTAETGRRPLWQAALILGPCVALAFWNSTILLGLIGLALCVCLMPLASWLALLFFASALAFREPFNFHPVYIGPFRFYAGDAVLYLFACGCVFYLWDTIQRRRAAAPPSSTERLLTLCIVLAMATGVFSAIYGVALGGLAYRDALGDYRRLYGYMLGFFVPLLLPFTMRRLGMLRLAFFAGGAGAMAFGAFRMLTGRYYRQELEHWQFVRLMADDEVLTLALLLGLLVAILESKPGLFTRSFALAFAGAAVAFMAISGWRMGWFFPVAVPFLVHVCLTAWRGHNAVQFLRRTAMLGVGLACLAAISFGFVAAVFPDSADYTLTLLAERSSKGIPIIGDQRYYVFGAALKEFVQYPIFGRGLGFELTYFQMTSIGDFVGNKGTTHNLFLDVLYQTGIVGFVFFAAIHIVFVRYVWRRAKRIPAADQALMAALFVGYLCTMLHYSVEPVQISGMVVMYLMMGFMIRMVREARCGESPAGNAAA